MRREVPDGERYWNLVSPHWLALNKSWDGGANSFLSRFRKLPAKVQHLYPAHWCQSEVTNGGFYQFFHNTTGLLAPEAVTGFEAIGAPELADVLKRAMTYFGSPYPRDRTERMAKLPPHSNRPRAEWNPFVAHDREFDDWFRDDYHRWEKLADKYASDA